ncbi:hypothetical protein Lesp01_06700 [Lentzea sp. NBRC 102530]|nr:hypothetical protein Lesp01_06700 [Lentzea sp. NBRC 102530]
MSAPRWVFVQEPDFRGQGVVRARESPWSGGPRSITHAGGGVLAVLVFEHRERPSPRGRCRRHPPLGTAPGDRRQRFGALAEAEAGVGEVQLGPGAFADEQVARGVRPAARDAGERFATASSRSFLNRIRSTEDSSAAGTYPAGSR